MPRAPHEGKAELKTKPLAQRRASSQDDNHQVTEEDSEMEDDGTVWHQQEEWDIHRVQSGQSPAGPLPPFSAALSDMMVSLGDWPAPQPGSLAVLEPVLAREVSALIRRAADAHPRRTLDAVHLLWAARRDALLTSRVLHFLELRSLTMAVSADSVQLQTDGPERPSPMLARCREFCDEIGAPPPPDDDPEAAARRARLDRLTRVMSAAQYQVFTAVRLRSGPRNKSCRAWLEARWPEGAPPARPAVWPVILFVLKELVALLVDACMLVRAESVPEPVGLPPESLTADHVREAIRRLQTAASPRADMLLVR